MFLWNIRLSLNSRALQQLRPWEPHVILQGYYTPQGSAIDDWSNGGVITWKEKSKKICFSAISSKTSLTWSHQDWTWISAVRRRRLTAWDVHRLIRVQIATKSNLADASAHEQHETLTECPRCIEFVMTCLGVPYELKRRIENVRFPNSHFNVLYFQTHWYFTTLSQI
jgi:hypothetical protein